MNNNKDIYFLKSLHIDSFGAFNDKYVGEFSPGLNILHGANEAGKSTISNFISSVLIGWPTKNVRAGNLNTYKNSLSTRSGSLLFKSINDKDKTCSLTRSGNKPLQITGHANDIKIPPAQTYSTLSSISAYKLLDLSNSMVKSNEEMTAKFLAEGSGTNTAPSNALESIDKNIFAYGSKSAVNQASSITLIERRMDDYAHLIAIEEQKRDQIADAVKNLPEKKQEIQNLEHEIEMRNKRIDDLKYALGQINGLKQQAQLNVDIKIGQGSDNNNSDNSEDYSQQASKKLKFCALISFSLALFVFLFTLIGVISIKANVASVCFLILAVVFLILARHQKTKHDRNLSKLKDQDNSSSDKSDDIDKSINQKINDICLSLNVLPDNIEREISNLQNKNKRESGILKALNNSIQQVNGQINASKDNLQYHQYLSEYVRLKQKKDLLIKEYFSDLLCKKILIDAVHAWQTECQPNIYKQASKYLNILTNGKWTQIYFDDKKLYIKDATGHKILDADILSTSTRQIVFLSIKLAIVDLGQNNYGSIPIVCDDIMVCFDKSRAQACLDALNSLAKHRQILLFTNNDEVVLQARAAKLDCNILEL